MKVEEIVKKAFPDASIIFEDGDIVISKRDNSFMVHNICESTIEYGSYLNSFEEAALNYLKRKRLNPKIIVDLSEEDISDLQNGKTHNWTFESDKGISIDIVLTHDIISI